MNNKEILEETKKLLNRSEKGVLNRKIAKLESIIFNVESSLTQRIIGIEKQMESHSMGVNNVYNEFKEIKSLIENDEIKKSIFFLKELKENIDKNNKYIEKPEIKEMYEFMKNFQNQMEYLVDSIKS